MGARASWCSGVHCPQYQLGGHNYQDQDCHLGRSTGVGWVTFLCTHILSAFFSCSSSRTSWCLSQMIQNYYLFKVIFSKKTKQVSSFKRPWNPTFSSNLQHPSSSRPCRIQTWLLFFFAPLSRALDKWSPWRAKESPKLLPVWQRQPRVQPKNPKTYPSGFSNSWHIAGHILEEYLVSIFENKGCIKTYKIQHIIYSYQLIYFVYPSWERSHIPPGEKEKTSNQKWFGEGFVIVPRRELTNSLREPGAIMEHSQSWESWKNTSQPLCEGIKRQFLDSIFVMTLSVQHGPIQIHIDPISPWPSETELANHLNYCKQCQVSMWSSFRAANGLGIASLWCYNICARYTKPVKFLKFDNGFNIRQPQVFWKITAWWHVSTKPLSLTSFSATTAACGQGTRGHRLLNPCRGGTLPALAPSKIHQVSHERYWLFNRDPYNGSL